MSLFTFYNFIFVIYILCFINTINCKVFEADPSSPNIREAAELAADHIIETEGWSGNLNVIFSATREVFDGFLYNIHFEIITEYELIHYHAQVFKDMGGNTTVKSYKLGDQRRWRPDKQLGRKERERLSPILRKKNEEL